MRDRSRIPKILKELEQIWKMNPDLRLGQIMVIAARPKMPCPEIFYMEDEDLLNGIQSMGKKEALISEKNNKTPYWELYPEIIRIDIAQITVELIQQFIEVARNEHPNLILTPKGMMQLVGAPVSDSGWLNRQKERTEKLRATLKQLQENGIIKAVEIGYKVSN